MNKLILLILIASAFLRAAQAAAKKEEVDPFVAKWVFYNNVTKYYIVTIHKDGTASSDKLEGVWKPVESLSTDRKYVIYWANGKYVNFVQLNRDNTKFFGKCADGVKLKGELAPVQDKPEPDDQTLEPFKTQIANTTWQWKNVGSVKFDQTHQTHAGPFEWKCIAPFVIQYSFTRWGTSGTIRFDTKLIEASVEEIDNSHQKSSFKITRMEDLPDLKKNKDTPTNDNSSSYFGHR